MVRKVQTFTGQAGYRSQLERARRFLERAEAIPGFAELEFQDMMWAFFQNCWHVKDWIDNDENVPKAMRSSIVKMALASPALKACEQLCNGTKHFGQKRKKRRNNKPPATQKYIETTVYSEHADMDCIVDNGAGKEVSGMMLARHCLDEWDFILKAHNLRAVFGEGAL